LPTFVHRPNTFHWGLKPFCECVRSKLKVGGDVPLMTQGEIHNLKSRQQTITQKILRSDNIADRDKKILIKGNDQFPSFLTYLRNQEISDSRINRYLSCLRKIIEYVDWEIEQATKTRITDFIGQMNSDNFCKENGDPYKTSTKNEYKKALRKLYTDYIEEFHNELDVPQNYDSEELISFTLTKSRNFTDSDRLPTPETVKKLVENASKTRDKAYLMLLWSTGGRHGEILGLKWRDVKFTNSIGKVIFRDTKTGGDHTVPMGEAYPFMKKHRENDPQSNNPEEFVFRSLTADKQLKANGGCQIINRAREKTSIPERIKTNPHAFRKGRTSYWARQEKNEAWICRYMNWAQGNQIVRHYCRIAQEDVEKGVSQHLGLELKEENDSREESKVLTPCECHECGYLNGFEEDICSECGTVLSSGSLFMETQIEEKASEFKDRVIMKETRFDPEELDKEAEQFMKDYFDKN